MYIGHMMIEKMEVSIMAPRYSFKWWDSDIVIDNEKGDPAANFKPTPLQADGHEQQGGSPNDLADSFSGGVLLYGLFDQVIEPAQIAPEDASLDSVEANLRRLVQQAEAAIAKIPSWREYARRHPEVSIGHTGFSAITVHVPIDLGQVVAVREGDPEIPDIVKERIAPILSELEEIGTLEWLRP